MIPWLKIQKSWLKKENEVTKDRVIRDIENLFENEEEDFCKPVRVDDFWSNNCVEYENIVI